MDFRAEINRHLYPLSLELDPTDDSDEQRHRHDILVAAGQRALAAAAESPGGEPSEARKRAILAAMMTYGRARLAGDDAVEFRVERSSNGKLASAPSWMIAMVEKVTRDLIRQGWDKAPEREAAGHFVSKKGRYGEAQKKGTQRRFDTENKRIASVRSDQSRLSNSNDHPADSWIGGSRPRRAHVPLAPPVADSSENSV